MTISSASANCRPKSNIGSSNWPSFSNWYLCGIAGMFGTPEPRLAAAENLDVVGADIEANMNAARATLAKLKATR